jgi:hypothetical protein
MLYTSEKAVFIHTNYYNLVEKENQKMLKIQVLDG